MAAKLRNELKKMQRNPCEGISGMPDDGDIMFWKAVISG